MTAKATCFTQDEILSAIFHGQRFSKLFKWRAVCKKWNDLIKREIHSKNKPFVCYKNGAYLLEENRKKTADNYDAFDDYTWLRFFKDYNNATMICCNVGFVESITEIAPKENSNSSFTFKWEDYRCRISLYAYATKIYHGYCTPQRIEIDKWSEGGDTSKINVLKKKDVYNFVQVESYYREYDSSDEDDYNEYEYEYDDDNDNENENENE